MTAKTSLGTLSAFLSALWGPTPNTALDLIEGISDDRRSCIEYHAMIRLAALHPGNDLLWFYRIENAWSAAGHPPLKPNATRRKVLLLADFTAHQLLRPMTVMCAARGVRADINLPEFDSVEQGILNETSRTYTGGYDLIVVCLSPQWLEKHLGPDAIPNRRRVDDTIETLRALLGTLTSRTAAAVVVTNFPETVLATPAAHIVVGDRVGFGAAVDDVNRWLATGIPDRVSVVDLADALFEAGGRRSIGVSNYLRARIPFEPDGIVAVAREIASAIAQVSGKSPRALVTDWDNTLWGGEVADVGSEGIVCGRDSTDGLGYVWVQEAVKRLKSVGILLSAASRNDPGVVESLENNSALVLTPDEFASVHVGLGAKSEMIDDATRDLGFESDLMVFMDDGVFDIVEVLEAHPYIDVIKAGPEPETTLRRLTGSRLFNVVKVSSEDLMRGNAAAALREQRNLKSECHTLDDFLRKIRMRVTVDGLDESNIARVEQLFQKTNQFNLTTKRYSSGDLQSLQRQGAEFGVFTLRRCVRPAGNDRCRDSSTRFRRAHHR